MVAADQVTWSLPPEQNHKLCADIAGVLKSAKVPKPYFTKQERTAIKELQKEKTIIILPADKGMPRLLWKRKNTKKKWE